MPHKRRSPKKINHKLREAEILLSQGQTVLEAAKQIGVTEQTYCRWRKEYGGMHHHFGKPIRPLWLLTSDRSLAAGRLAGESQTSGAHLAAGGSQDAGQTTKRGRL